MKQLYEIIRKLAGKYKRTYRPIKDKNGNVLTSDEDQLKRWREHFEELLNRPPPQNPPDITPAEAVLQINCESPSKAEIEKSHPSHEERESFRPRQNSCRGNQG